MNFYNTNKGLPAMLYSRRIFATVAIVELCVLSATLEIVFGAGPAMHQRLAELARSEAMSSFATDAADGPDDASLLRGGSAPGATSQSDNLVLSPVVSNRVAVEVELGVVGATEYMPVRSGGGGGGGG